MSRALGSFLFSLFIVVSASGSAAAAPTQAEKQKAAHSFQIGSAAYARGDFAAAAAAFEQAAFYAPHPSTLLNAAESWELAENPARAAQLCDRVLDTPQLEPQHRQAAAKQLAKLEKKIGTLVIRAPDKTRIDVDDHEETASRLRVAPGAHKLKATGSDGEARTQTVTVEGGETKDVDFLAPPPLKPEETKPSPLITKNQAVSPGPPVATWIAFGAAAAATGVAVYFGVKTLQAKNVFDASPTTTSRDEFHAARFGTDVAIGIAVVGVAVGVVLWLTSSPSPAASSDKGAARASIVRGTW